MKVEECIAVRKIKGIDDPEDRAVALRYLSDSNYSVRNFTRIILEVGVQLFPGRITEHRLKQCGCYPKENIVPR